MSIRTTPKSIIVSLVIADPGGRVERADLPVGVHDLVATLPGDVG